MVTLIVSSRPITDFSAGEWDSVSGRFREALIDQNFGMHGKDARVEGRKKWNEFDSWPSLENELYALATVYGVRNDFTSNLQELGQVVGWVQIQIAVPFPVNCSYDHPGESGREVYRIETRKRADCAKITLECKTPEALSKSIPLYTNHAYALIKEVAVYRLATSVLSQHNSTVLSLRSALGQIANVCEQGLHVRDIKGIPA